MFDSAAVSGDPTNKQWLPGAPWRPNLLLWVILAQKLNG